MYLEIVLFFILEVCVCDHSPTFQIVIDIESLTQIRCELVQGGLFINTITCTLEMYGYFKFVDKSDVGSVLSKLHNVVALY